MPIIYSVTARPDKRQVRRYPVVPTAGGTATTDRQWLQVYMRGNLPNVDTIDMHNTGEQTIYYFAAEENESKPTGGDQHYEEIAPGESVSEESDPYSIRVARSDPSSVPQLIVTVKYFSDAKMARMEAINKATLGG